MGGSAAQRVIRGNGIQKPPMCGTQGKVKNVVRRTFHFLQGLSRRILGVAQTKRDQALGFMCSRKNNELRSVRKR